MDLPNCAARRQADGQGDPHCEARLSRVRDEKERVKVAGAAAAIVVQVLLHANKLNAMAVGSMQVDWSNGKASLRISKSFEPVGFKL
jgi:hypothetical protein